MGIYVDRTEGVITGRFAVAQYEGQEYLEDDAPDLIALDLASAKAQMVAAVDAELARRLAAGVAYGGKSIQMRDDDRANINSMTLAAKDTLDGGPAWDEQFAWRCADNSYLPLDAEAMIDLGRTAKTWYLAMLRNAWALKDAARSASDGAALEAIDITTGWE